MYVKKATFTGGVIATYWKARKTIDEKTIEILKSNKLVRTDPKLLATPQGVDKLPLFNRAIWNGVTYGSIGGLFSFLQIGLTYYRGYWDPWNTLIAGSLTGFIVGISTKGADGMKYGFGVGSLIVLPFCIAETAFRLYIKDDDLLPYRPFISDNEESLKRFLYNQAIEKNPHIFGDKKKD